MKTKRLNLPAKISTTKKIIRNLIIKIFIYLLLLSDYGFLTDLTGIRKHNLPKLTSPIRTAKNKKIPIDNSLFFKCSTVRSNNFKDIPNNDFNMTMRGFSNNKIIIKTVTQK